MDTKSFQGNGVIITGASSGIGRALALRLSDQQAWIALAARDAERLEQLAADCRERGAQAIAIPTDVADEAACQHLVDRTCAEFGRIDMLVNNAGFSVTARLDEHTSLHPFEQVMQVNFMGQVYCTYHALPHLKETQGRIVGIEFGRFGPCLTTPLYGEQARPARLLRFPSCRAGGEWGQRDYHLPRLGCHRVS
jgi:NAD(P)-dependent dehydrogenase (short-subunit alcohol dehydrogenase family)